MRIHRETSSAFTALVAALLFLAVCAYIGAGLFQRLSPETLTVRAELFSIAESAEISGIAIRSEQTLLAEKPLKSLPENGRKYSAGESLAVFKDGNPLFSSDSAVFCSFTDGYEHLSPQMLFPFGKDNFSNILSLEKTESKDCFGKLISDDSWYFAARLTSGEIPDNALSCRLIFDGIGEAVPAVLWAVEDDCLLLRISSFSQELMGLRHSEAKLIFKEYLGFKIPQNALHRDENGKFYVSVLSAGLVEKRSVDIIYTGNDFFLVSSAELRQGDEIIERSSEDGYS